MIIQCHRTTALKIQNKGGNHGADWKGTKGTGTDYVTFECPGCKKRNKQSMYEVRMKVANNVLGFSCKACASVVEVTLPIGSAVGLIVTPDQYKKEKQGRHPLLHY